jgi:hypothetical protein
MNDDDLERSIRALREEGDRPAPQARLTRERILADLRPKARRRRAIWMIPVAALLAGSTVLAATGRLPDAFHAAARALGLEARSEEPNERDGRRSPRANTSSIARASETSSEAIVAPDPPAPASPEPAAGLPNAPDEPRGTAVRADAGAAKRAARRTTHAATPTAAAAPAPAEPAHAEASSGAPPPGAASAADDQGTLALYRRARQLHFVEQKPALALAAWDAYLAAEPHGPLSVDARYDRALCLVRLGRKQEARAALEPFAAGKYGTYRQTEARALLDAMP